MNKDYYIHPNIIKGFTKKTGVFNYKKLVILLKSVNRNYRENDAHTCAIMIRSVLDHIPPLLGFTDFADVANNYTWSPSHKKFMLALLDFKNEGDEALHTQISDKDDYLEIQNLPPTSNRLNILLEECLINGGTALPLKLSKPESKPKISFKINEEKFISWAHYIMGFNQGWAFRVFLEINNFHNNKLDYVSVKLKANTNDGLWESQHFTFDSPKDTPDRPYEIQPNKIEEVTVFLSQDMPQHTLINREKIARPDFDTDTIVLIISTESGVTQEIPIKPSWLQDG